MKRIITLAIVLLGIVAFSVPAYAFPVDTLISPAAGYSNPQAWSGAINPTEEEKWLEGVLGKTYNDPTIFYVDKNEIYFKDKELTSLDGWDPGFAWTYLVVKYDGYIAAFEDEGDNLVTIPESGAFDFAISHITFFGDDTTVLIPEPGTMILLGLGLLGLGIVVRKRF